MQQKTTRPTAAQLQQHSVLIAGAGFAGLATAWWMHQLGYQVTVVEVAPGLRRGGTPVDIRESVIEVVSKMGLLSQIVAHSLPPRPTEFLNADGLPLQQLPPPPGDTQPQEPGWEIERDTLLDLLFGQVETQVEFLFNNTIASIRETPDAVDITFANGQQRSFSLLLGCDGTHSAVRSMCFGDKASHLLFLSNYFSLTIVPSLLLPENTAQMLSVPGRTIMLNAYNGKTDIAFSFFAPSEIPYDRRDRDGQKQMICERFDRVAWRTQELLAEMSRSDNFYFSKLCQVRMPAWTTGRVALVGDAGYCPSPAAGMGGSMALLGAAALADAFRAHPGNVARAFQHYNTHLRPLVDEIQANAVDFGLKMFLPSSAEQIQQRNLLLNLR